MNDSAKRLDQQAALLAADVMGRILELARELSPDNPVDAADRIAYTAATMLREKLAAPPWARTKTTVTIRPSLTAFFAECNQRAKRFMNAEQAKRDAEQGERDGDK